MTEPRSVEKHLLLHVGVQVREPLPRGRTLEGVAAVAVHAREPYERLRQRLAAHALHGVAPKALDSPDGLHTGISPHPTPTPRLALRVEDEQHAARLGLRDV